MILTNLLFFYINESFSVVKSSNSTIGVPLALRLFYALDIRTNHIQTHIGQIALQVVNFRA